MKCQEFVTALLFFNVSRFTATDSSLFILHFRSLERVADGEVEGVGVFEAGDVEVTRLAGVVGEVEG